MLEQERLIERIGLVCRGDGRVAAAMLYGSFALGEGDRFSDVDCFVYFEEGAMAGVEPEAWVAQVGRPALFYQNEWGTYVTIFESLVRAEFHLEPASRMAELAKLAGEVYFPSAEAIILVDKAGALRESVRPLIGRPNDHRTEEDARFLMDSFLNWMTYGFNLMARGEWAHAAELLGLVQDFLLRMARVLAGDGGRWMVPTKLAERELSAEAYERFRRCTAAVEPEALRAAYWAAWAWGLEMGGELAACFGAVWPEQLAARLEGYFISLPTESG